MIVEGPGIPPGETATISGSTVTLTSALYYGRTPTITTTGATLVFMPQAQSAMVQSAGSGPFITPYVTPCIHQWSPAITGINGILFSEYGNNDTYAWTSSATLSTGSKTITGVILANSTSYQIPVGYTVTATGTGTLPANTTVVSNTNNSITLNNYPTGSGSATITVTPVLSAWETAYSSYVTTALADNYAVVIMTPWECWNSPWSTGESNRESMVAWLKSTYGGTAFGGSSVTGVTLIDTAGLSIFSSYDPNIY
jgi:hypothetical protein